MSAELKEKDLGSAPTILVEASGRHVHLSREAVDTLFGKGYQLTKVSELSQPGQYVCQERVSLVGPKGTLNNVVVLGPERPQVQVEISRTDAVTLGVPAPVRESGQIDDTPGVTVAVGDRRLSISKGVIVAQRHIHTTPQDAKYFGVKDRDVVRVAVQGERGAILNNVLVRVSPQFSTSMHIDYDEANAIGFWKGMRGQIIRPENTSLGGGVCMDLNKLVDAVTKEIMSRLQKQDTRPSVLVLEPDCPVAPLLEQQYGISCAEDTENLQSYDYVLVPRAKYHVFCTNCVASTAASQPAESKNTEQCPDKTLDWTDKKLIHERELAEACTHNIRCLRIANRAIVTALAADFIRDRGLTLIREG